MSTSALRWAWATVAAILAASLIFAAAKGHLWVSALSSVPLALAVRELALARSQRKRGNR